MEIVVGFQGKEHVTAGQVGRILAGMAGDGAYVLDTQNQLAATMVTANQVRVDTGDLVMHGRVATVETPETLTVESGVTGQKRNDLVVARYQKEASTSVESCELVVVKGTAVSYGDPSDPTINDGSILDGDSPVDVPLWRIPIDGLTPGTPVKLFEDTPSISELRDSVSQGESEIASLSAEMTQKLQKMSVEMIEPSVAASWIYAVAYLCTGGLWVGGNVSGSATAGRDGWIATIRLPVRVANRGRSILRGFFHNHLSGCWFTVSNSTVTLEIELQTSFSDGDTFSGLVPLTFL